MDLFCSCISTEERFLPFAKSHEFPQSSPFWGSPSTTQLRNIFNCLKLGIWLSCLKCFCEHPVSIFYSLKIHCFVTIKSEKLSNQFSDFFRPVSTYVLSLLLQSLYTKILQHHTLLRLYIPYSPTTTLSPQKVPYNPLAAVLGNGRQKPKILTSDSRQMHNM